MDTKTRPLPRRAAATAAGAVLALAAAGPLQAEGTKAYKYVDEQGNVVYGDHFPPEAAPKEKRKYNEHGVPIEDLPAEPTAEDLLRMQVEEELRARQARQEQERRERIEKLFRSYPTEQDLHRYHQGQIDAIYQRISANELRLRKLRDRLISLEEEAGGYDYPPGVAPGRPSLPEDLLREMVLTTEHIAHREADADTLRRTLERRQESYETDLDLYRQYGPESRRSGAVARAPRSER